MPETDITLTAEEFTIYASEKVSTGEYETATVSAEIAGEIDCEIDGPENVAAVMSEEDLAGGVDVTFDGELPSELREALYRAHRSLQDEVEHAARKRREGGTDPDRDHEV